MFVNLCGLFKSQTARTKRHKSQPIGQKRKEFCFCRNEMCPCFRHLLKPINNVKNDRELHENPSEIGYSDISVANFFEKYSLPSPKCAFMAEIHIS